VRTRGTASGLANWTASVPLQAGTNLIYITALDQAGNEGVDYVYVNVGSTSGGSTGGSTGGTSDTSSPTIAIGSPTTGSSYSTTQSYINLAGTAADNYGVSRVVWENTANGSRGTASGTTSWAVANIPLAAGSNYLQVTVYDSAGNSGTDSLLVTRSSTTTTTTTTSGPAPSLRLAPGSGFSALLYWTSTTWSSVDVYRNNTRIKSVSNTGSTSDTVPTYGSYSYKLCAPGSTTNCSNSVNISF
jgi:hypothetical protein